MTKRALLLGLLGVCLVCGFTFFNDMVIRGSFMVGNFLPFSIIGTLILFVMLINPVLWKVRRSWALSGRELAFVVALPLFVCFIPGRGLMHHFHINLMMPHHYNRTNQSWRADDVRVQLDRITDWGHVVKVLREATKSDKSSAAALLKGQLSDNLVANLPQAEQPVDAVFQNRLIGELNDLIESGQLAGDMSKSPIALPVYAQHLLSRGNEMTLEDRRSVTRAIIDVALEGGIKLRRPSAVDLVPPVMLADPRVDDRALDGFVSGVGEGEKGISLTKDIPWNAWHGTLSFWIPVILFMCVAGIGLSLMLHRQWATHEHLPYPTVELTRMLLPADGHSTSTLFSNRFFWIGLIPVLLIYMNNLAFVWWPEYIIPVELHLYLGQFVRLCPTFYRSAGGWWMMFNPLLIFTVIGFAYFLPKDVSLSLGLAPFIFGYVTGTLNSYGVAMGPAMSQPTIHTFCYGGAYVGMFCVILYTGRHYYGSVLRRCFGIKRGGDPVEPYAVWGGRAMVLGIVGFVLATHQAGLQIPVALMYVIALLVILTVVSRLLAEAGVYYLHTNLFPSALLWGFFGESGLGTNQILIIGILSCTLFVDPRECFMPYVVESLKLGDDMKSKLGRMAAMGMAAITIGLFVAIPATMYFQYKNGAVKAGDGWTTGTPPRQAIEANLQLRKTLEAQGALKAVDEKPFFTRIADSKPVPEAMITFGITFALVLLFTLCRQRLSWWPLHPVMFLTLATWQSTLMAGSFLIGWLIKHAVTKYGGGKLYQELKPLMAGLIAGEFVAGIIAMIIGIAYYYITGEPPKAFSIQR